MSQSTTYEHKALGPLKKYTPKVIAAPIFKLFEVVCELIVPILVKKIIDEGLMDGGAHFHEWNYILMLGGIMLALAVFGFAMTMITQYLSARVASDYAYDLRLIVNKRILSLSSAQLDEFGRSKALNLLNNDSTLLQNGVNMMMRLVLRCPFLVIGSVVASFLVNVWGGLVVLAALVLSALVIMLVAFLTPKQYAALQHELDIISTQGDDEIEGARVVRAFNKEGSQAKRFSSSTEKYRKQALFIAKINALVNPLTFFFVDGAIALIFYFGAYQQPFTALTTGDIVALVSYLSQSLAALVMFTRLLTSLSRAYASKKRIDAFLSYEPGIVSGPLEEEPEVAEGEPIYEFQDVCLNFGGENDALHNINLTIHKGESVGIIGGTGSGKSTLLAMLLRYYDPRVGKVLFHGHDIKDSQLENIRKDIAMVSQKPQLFQGTIRDNLTLGASYTDEEIQAALHDSLAEEFVSHYKDGIDHPVEEGGQNFSGGQKQRLLIARALLSNRPILILDDSTSALDYKSDLEVRTNIKKRKGITTILVSQRATSIKDCDHIYVLDKGEIVGEGNHEELLASCPIYQEIYQTQVKVK